MKILIIGNEQTRITDHELKSANLIAVVMDEGYYLAKCSDADLNMIISEDSLFRKIKKMVVSERGSEIAGVVNE